MLRYCLLVILAFNILHTPSTFGQMGVPVPKNAELKMEKMVWSKDEEAVKQMVENFLFAAGNYDVESIPAMVTEHAVIGMARFTEGYWITATYTVEEFFDNAVKSNVRSYYEHVREYTIHISEGHLAFVKADAVLYVHGIPQTYNMDYFTLLKENGKWRFMNLSFTAKPVDVDDQHYDLQVFARGYAHAWCSQKPEFVASYFAEDGTITVNDGDPANGRPEIANVAKGFMHAFPDMVVTMDSLTKTPEGIEFHWTLTGTNTGPGGSGNKVDISGFELWQFGDDGLIKESKGRFDAKEYDRQIKHGLEE